jgi:hypothetical protein
MTANTFVGSSEDRLSRLELQFGVRMAIAIVFGLAVWIVPAWWSLSQERAACESATSEQLLKCVAGLVEAAKASDQLNDPLRKALETLAETEGYSGTSSDLEKLKTWSIELKDRDPLSNRATIAELDNAIASQKEEIRAAVSIEAAVKEAVEQDGLTAGTNVQSIFVQRKLTFLESERAKFYDRGPFEAIRRSLLASAIEESYFINGANADKDKLRREIRIVDELQDRYNAPSGYLTFRQIHLQKNSNLFWRASLSFALGDKSGFTKVLRDLARVNSDFDLESKNIGHVYVYRVFNLPYEIRVMAGDGEPAPEIDDPGLLNRYFNPAQLALVACAQLQSVGSAQGIDRFKAAVTNMALHDYYVVAGSSQDNEKLRQFEATLQEVVHGEELRGQLLSLIESVIDQGRSFSHTIEIGAKACDVDDVVRDKIYSPFQLRSTIKAHTEAPYGTRLLFGGRLDASQASAVAEFLKRTLNAPALQAPRKKLGVNTTVFIARVGIDR